MKRHSHPHKKGAALAERLKRQSRKLTGPRRAILALLDREAHPLTIREIHAHLELESARCDLATVYRSIRLLESCEMVKRFDFGDGVARYELIRDGGHEHHHHLICTDCAKVVEIDECFPAELERKIALGNGFAAISHRLEFFGVCPACQDK